MKIESSKRVWVTSDTHFNHVSICGPTLTKWDKGYRNFSSLQEMNDTIIDRLNMKVREDDILIHVGDVIMGHKPEVYLPQIMTRINCGEIHLVYGNHDDRIRTNPALQELFTSVQSELFLSYHNEYFHFYHFPLGSWDKIGKGSMQLHGHCHGSYSRTYGRQKDIGVDSNNFYPHLLDDIIQELNQIPVVSPDHHSDKTSYH